MNLQILFIIFLVYDFSLILNCIQIYELYSNKENLSKSILIYMLKKLYNYMKYLSNRDEFLKRSLNKIDEYKSLENDLEKLN